MNITHTQIICLNEYYSYIDNLPPAVFIRLQLLLLCQIGHTLVLCSILEYLLHCTALHHTLLYCTELQCSVQYSAVQCQRNKDWGFRMAECEIRGNEYFLEHLEYVTARAPPRILQWHCSAVVQWGSAILHCMSTIQCCIVVLQYSGALQCNNTVLHCSYTIQCCIVVLQYNAALQCYNTVVHCSATIQLCIVMLQYSGALQWYSAVRTAVD